jgi:DNA-binding response OmpR family regulator
MVKADAPIRLLVVDGDDEHRTLLRRRFTRIGYDVMEAAEAAKALSLIGMIPFDLVLLDVHTPAVDGLEVLRRVRENRPAAELPVIALTRGSAREDVSEALALGANDHLVRPVDFDVACLRAEMQIRRRPASDAARASRARLETQRARLQDTVAAAENTAPLLAYRGTEAWAPLVGVLRAATVLTKLCDAPELTPAARSIDEAAGALDALLAASLQGGERRSRAPKEKLRVLSADDDAESRFAVRAILHAAEVEVELVDVATGLQAALAVEGQFFDLILVNLSAAEAFAGVRAIRRHERQSRSRRTPILALAPDTATAARARDAGADLHMTQPITAESLLASVAAALARESAELSAVA